MPKTKKTATRHSKKEPPTLTDDWLAEFTPYAFYRITNKLNLMLRDNLRRLKVSQGRWRVMSVLYPAKNLSIGEIAELTVMEQATISRVITQMERDRLVKRNIPDHDTRIAYIKLSRIGRSSFEALHESAAQHEAIALNGFKPSEIKQLKSYLRRISRNIETKSK